jgi:hypothetical protein
MRNWPDSCSLAPVVVIAYLHNLHVTTNSTGGYQGPSA